LPKKASEKKKKVQFFRLIDFEPQLRETMELDLLQHLPTGIDSH